MIEYQRPPIRVAMMGLGRAAFWDHYQVFKAHPALFRVVAACDLLKERRDIIAKDFPQCKMYRQYADMLDERDIDLVDITTCSSQHVEHALAALKKGFWTLVESPLALTLDDAQVLRGQAQKSKNRLLVMQRGLYGPDYLLAKQMMGDARLGTIQHVRVCKEDYVRRDDWQCVKRLGGGASYYAMPDLMIQALRLMSTPPVQMWSELKRLASLGDSEDYVRVCLKTRDQLTAEVIFDGGALPGKRQPSFEIRGDAGIFSVYPGESEGTLRMVDPNFKFPRRRSSVRTPPIVDMHEEFPVVEERVELAKGTLCGPSAFWKHIYDTVRTAAPFPIALDESIAAVKFSQLMKKMSPFGK